MNLKLDYPKCLNPDQANPLASQLDSSAIEFVAAGSPDGFCSSSKEELAGRWGQENVLIKSSCPHFPASFQILFGSGFAGLWPSRK